MTGVRLARLGLWGFLLAGACVVAPGDGRADEPLRVRVDQLIDGRNDGPAAPLTEDAEFVRRVYLDLAGRIPTADEAQGFLADAAGDKRAALIDRLLDGPEYARRMADVVHVMLMERLGDHEEWRKFLVRSFEQNKPWNRFVREVLNPDAEDETSRGAALFLTKRLENYGQNPVDLPGLTRDVGRLFLGVDLQCAQCHDHLFIADYKQADFQGLHAFVSHAAIRRDTKFPAVAEGLVDKKLEFMSVFTQEPRETGPRLPGGSEVEVAAFPKGEEFATPPDRKTQFPGVPKFRPLGILAEQLPTGENAAFCRNSANRWWSVLLGRGLVHPLDLSHAGNPPTHPELLGLLAAEFAGHGFDVKWLLRELANTRVYQRSGRLAAADSVPEATYRVAVEKPLSAEQLLRSMLVATGQSVPVAGGGGGGGEGGGVQEPAEDKLKPAREKFEKAFAGVPREPEGEFAPSVKVALFLLNDPLVQEWLRPAPGNSVEVLSKLDPPAAAERLYLTVLSRPPTADERAEVERLLSDAGGERTRAIGNVMWALLASTEFCLNH